MKGFLYVMSVLWIAMGSCLVIYTAECKRVLSKVLRGVDQRFLSPVPAVLGLLLMVAAPQARNSGFIRLLGLLGIAKGVFVFMNPKGYCDQVVTWCLDQASDQTYRFFGIISLILGTALLSWIL
ncbi:MAG: hypothetical protein JRI36_13645 [Deltaproteobacteria bacterium]|nr:hypothetical protein [Deltaproteobacteria bacterium]